MMTRVLEITRVSLGAMLLTLIDTGGKVSLTFSANREISGSAALLRYKSIISFHALHTINVQNTAIRKVHSTSQLTFGKFGAKLREPSRLSGETLRDDLRIEIKRNIYIYTKTIIIQGIITYPNRREEPACEQIDAKLHPCCAQ